MMARTPKATPTPMPAFAPVLRPEEVAELVLDADADADAEVVGAGLGELEEAVEVLNTDELVLDDAVDVDVVEVADPTTKV